MKHAIERRDILILAELGSVVFASGLLGFGCGGSQTASARSPAPAAAAPSGTKSAGVREDFVFLQLSDTHWGYSGSANPHAAMTLKDTVATINASSIKPDFVVFTGDLTHMTDDPALRRQRLREFREIVGGLAAKDLHFLPGEHDASKDAGAAFKEQFRGVPYSFDHKGVHFVILDNASDAGSGLGAGQLTWLASDLATYEPATPIVVFAHRPLFDLFPAWDWATSDGSQAIAILAKYPSVTVFYGHIHQEHHKMTGAIRHHSAKSLIFPLPAPGSVPKKSPLPWDPEHPNQGLGYRSVDFHREQPTPAMHELEVKT